MSSNENTGDSTDGKRTADTKEFPWITRREALAAGGVAIGATTLASGSALAAEDDGTEDHEDDDGTNEFRVTVTNLTHGQPFTPPAVALHEPTVEVFSVGEAANELVMQLAENGNLDPLLTLVGETPEIRAAGVGDAPLVPRDDPGDTGHPYYASFTLSADESATHLTFLSMLIATNDGFVGVDTVELPEAVNESKTLHANGYDAGTEQNTERFDDMVPPAQSLISGNEAEGGTAESDPEIAEDEVIRPHPGISGDADLQAETYGWDDPAAAVHVEKIAEDSS